MLSYWSMCEASESHVEGTVIYYKWFVLFFSAILMDYPFEKLIGGMFLKKDRVFQQDPVQFCGHFF